MRREEDGVISHVKHAFHVRGGGGGGSGGAADGV